MVAEHRELKYRESDTAEEKCGYPDVAGGNGHHDDHPSCNYRIHVPTDFLHPF